MPSETNALAFTESISMADPIQPIRPAQPSQEPLKDSEATNAEGVTLSKNLINLYMNALKDAIAHEKSRQAERKKEQRKAVE